MSVTGSWWLLNTGSPDFSSPTGTLKLIWHQTPPILSKEAMSNRIEELGGLDSVPTNRYLFLKNFLLWVVIALLLVSIIKNFQVNQ